jgi:hypothetical protein
MARTQPRHVHFDEEPIFHSPPYTPVASPRASPPAQSIEQTLHPRPRIAAAPPSSSPPHTPPRRPLPETHLHTPTSPANSSPTPSSPPIRTFMSNHPSTSSLPRLIYDVRDSPSRALSGTSAAEASFISATELAVPVTNPPVPFIRLLCRRFPWEVIVRNSGGVTCGDVLQAVYNTLNQPITPNEWWIVKDEDREIAMTASLRNCARSPARVKSEGVKRVDWLGLHTAMRGVGRDDKLVESRIPNPDGRDNTFALVLDVP